MKKCSTSLVFKEMQIKTKMRYYYTLIRIATIKKRKMLTIPNAAKDVKELDFAYIPGGNGN